MKREICVQEMTAQSVQVLPDREALALVNLNLAAPINAAVAANVLSDHSVAAASATQSIGNITQTI